MTHVALLPLAELLLAPKVVRWGVNNGPEFNLVLDFEHELEFGSFFSPYDSCYITSLPPPLLSYSQLAGVGGVMDPNLNLSPFFLM